MGKLVEELTPTELLQERDRCRAHLRFAGQKSAAGKGLHKRLIAIERRIQLESK